MWSGDIVVRICEKNDSMVSPHSFTRKAELFITCRGVLSPIEIHQDGRSLQQGAYKEWKGEQIC
jgi:hypothetical protein